MENRVALAVFGTVMAAGGASLLFRPQPSQPAPDAVPPAVVTSQAADAATVSIRPLGNSAFDVRPARSPGVLRPTPTATASLTSAAKTPVAASSPLAEAKSELPKPLSASPEPSVVEKPRAADPSKEGSSLIIVPESRAENALSPAPQPDAEPGAVRSATPPAAAESVGRGGDDALSAPKGNPNREDAEERPETPRARRSRPEDPSHELAPKRDRPFLRGRFTPGRSRRF